MNKNLCRTANEYESLVCWVCDADLLETGWGNCVWAEIPDLAAIPRFVDVYCVCRGRCDKWVQTCLRVENLQARWISLNELTNPLEHKYWEEATSRRIDRGEYSEAAAVKISRVLKTMAPFASREPTEQDIIRFQQLRSLDGL